ncbi:unnamed protein product [Lampetra fluviatilis]
MRLLFMSHQQRRSHPGERSRGLPLHQSRRALHLLRRRCVQLRCAGCRRSARYPRPRATEWHFISASRLCIIRSVDWSEHEALRVLPTALDDDSLAVFYSILEADRSSLVGACAAMAAIYEPSLTIRRKFQLRKRGDTESPLAFRSALLALSGKEHSGASGPQGRASCDSMHNGGRKLDGQQQQHGIRNRIFKSTTCRDAG